MKRLFGLDINSAWVAGGYFILYFIYLFFVQENEFAHWLSMVAIPFSIVYFFPKRTADSPGFKAVLSSFGLEKSRLRNGVLWAILIGLTLSFLQIFLSRDNSKILAILQDGSFLYRFPAALLLMMLTAGFTEEFLFRGFLQTRFQEYFRSKWVAIAITSFLFGIYHLPYAYLNPHWPSHGNFLEALSSALGQGVPIGLILGVLYWRSGNNLLACVVLHALVDSFPAMLIFKF